jgi:hypothetical protein
LGCVEYPVMTAEAALRHTNSTNSLIDLLQAEEDLLIRKFGPPWVEHPHTFSEGCLNNLQRSGARSAKTQRVAGSGTAIPWRWPWS